MVARDLTICVLLLLIAALLGVFVHPLLWSVAVLALAWLVGRDPQTRHPRAKQPPQADKCRSEF